MRFLLDENVSYRICPYLKAAGHDAVHVSEIGLTSTDDQVILDRARDQDRVLVSGDHDFVQLLFASGETRPSVVLVRDIDAVPSTALAALLLAPRPAHRTTPRRRHRHPDTRPRQGTAATAAFDPVFIQIEDTLFYCYPCMSGGPSGALVTGCCDPVASVTGGTSWAQSRGASPLE